VAAGSVVLLALLRRGSFPKEDHSREQTMLPAPSWELSERTGGRIELQQVCQQWVGSRFQMWLLLSCWSI